MPKVTSNRCVSAGYNPVTQSQSDKRRSIHSLEETRMTMDIQYTSEGPKFVHKCNPGCKPSKLHACGFENCPTQYTTGQKRNVSAHELSQHVDKTFWPRCSWPDCGFRYCDPSSYFKHKCSKHGHFARKTRDASTLVHGSQQGSQSTADKRSAREDSFVSDDSSFDGSATWLSTARLSGPIYSDFSDTSSFDDTVLSSSSYHANTSSYASGNYLPTSFAPSLSVDIGRHLAIPLTAPYSTADTLTGPYFVPNWTPSPYVDWAVDTADVYSGPSFKVPDSPPSFDLSGISFSAKPATSSVRLEDYFSEKPATDARALCFDEPTLEVVLAELVQIEQSHKLSGQDD